MYYIGFATQFYTLWEVESSEKWSTNPSDDHYVSGINTAYIFHQNLSFDLEKAKERAKELTGIIPQFDENLQGKTQSWSTFNNVPFPSELFEFGNFAGCRIVECTDEWQLMRVYYESADSRRRVYARRALINLGSLKRYTWYNGDGKRINYATGSEITTHEAKLADAQINRGHHFSDGERVKISARCTARFGFESYYGWTTIQKFVDSDFREFIYMGSSPCDINEGDEVELSATIKHDSYNDQPQTKLLRIKLLNVVA